MRQKYIDEKWPDLMVFGVTTDGLHCVTDCNETIDVPVAEDGAAKIVEHYNKLKEEFSAMVQAFNAADEEAFNQFWYGERK